MSQQYQLIQSSIILSFIEDIDFYMNFKIQFIFLQILPVVLQYLHLNRTLIPKLWLHILEGKKWKLLVSVANAIERNITQL